MLDMKGNLRFQRFCLYLLAPGSPHVLLAIGLPHEIAHGSLRLTLNEENTKEEMDTTVAAIKEIDNQTQKYVSLCTRDFVKNRNKGINQETERITICTAKK